jgi:hypothetical protein
MNHDRLPEPIVIEGLSEMEQMNLELVLNIPAVKSAIDVGITYTIEYSYSSGIGRTSILVLHENTERIAQFDITDYSSW